MRDDDARRQSLAELHERRKQVIRLHKKQYGVMQIVELDRPELAGGADRHRSLRGRRRCRAQTERTRQEKRRGPETLNRARGPYSKTDRRKAARAVENGVRAVDPRRCGPADRKGVQDRLIGPRRRQISEALGLHAPEPIRRAYERSPEAVKTWLEKDYPAIAERAK